MTSQGIRLTNMLYNHGPGSILETVQGPVVVKGWDEMISEISKQQDRSSGQQLSAGEWRRHLEIIEPRLSSQLLQHGASANVKLHSLPSNESLGISTRKALVKTEDFPNFHLCRKGAGHPNYSVLFRLFNNSGKYQQAQCPICRQNERTSPIRFASACNAGHLDDLPWNFMVHKKKGCSGQIFKWKEESASTSGISIECSACKEKILLNQGVGKLPRIPCTRNDPSGVMNDVDICDRSMNLVLRSSTMVWQSESITAITIPDDDIKICLGHMKKHVPVGGFQRAKMLTTQTEQMPLKSDPCVVKRLDVTTMAMVDEPCPFASGAHSRQDQIAWVYIHCLQSFITARGMSTSDFNRYLKPILEKLDDGELPASEFTKAWDDHNNPTRVSNVEAIEAEFKALFSNKKDKWPEHNPLFIKKKREEDNHGEGIIYTFGDGTCKVNLRAHRVTKLRTVTALKGFSRPVRDANGNLADLVSLSHSDENGIDWFAAVKSQGEGILITFDDESSLCENGKRWNCWSSKFATLVADPPENKHLYRGLRNEPLTTKINEKHLAELHPMFVWWHTLSHHLIRTIQQDTGYSSSAISERIFAHKIDGRWTGGILLYVTEGGMDGTLGGLTSLVPNIQKYLDIIGQESDNCSNDPLCTDVTSSSLEHDRACYSCTYNSETSCGHRNLFLDRLLLRECVGL